MKGCIASAGMGVSAQQDQLYAPRIPLAWGGGVWI